MSGSRRNGGRQSSFIERWLDRSSGHHARGRNKRRPGSFRPALEALEARWLPNAYLVTTTADNGSNTTPTIGSLRSAILQADSGPSGSSISFSIGNATETISPPPPLPAVTATNLTITTSPPPGLPLQHITLDGSAAGAASGLTLNGPGCTVEGSGISNLFVIQHFSQDGILVQASTATISNCELVLNAFGIFVSSASQGKITNNYIGTNTSAATGMGNHADGIRIMSSGTATATQNLILTNNIAGNSGSGISMAGPGTSKNSVLNNQIGTVMVAATAPLFALANQQDGVLLLAGANNNQIGAAGLYTPFLGSGGNLISSNGIYGVQITDAGSTQNTVQGNMIGTNNLGNGAVAPGNGGSTSNGHGGVVINNGAQNNLVGGGGGLGSAGQGNLISANLLDGVLIGGSGTNTNQLEDNFIGTDVTGAVQLANGGPGVSIDLGAASNTLSSNLISGNAGAGVLISDSGTTGNLVQANTIGTTQNREAILANGADGVTIQNAASSNTIGGSTGSTTMPSEGNLISGNHNNGVTITGSATTGNLVQGNAIGIDALGMMPLPNVDGVSITGGASGNTVGGNAANLGNVISGNSQAGVLLDSSASSNIAQDNLIGTDPTGTFPLSNVTDGIDVYGSSNTVAGNLVSGNGASGVNLQGSQNTMQSNMIGTNLAGTGVVANVHDGVFIAVMTGSGGNTLGGTASGSGNLISGNDGNGINITGSLSTGILVLGNKIGTDVTGTIALPNQGAGVYLQGGANHNTVGASGTSSGPANLISGNAGSGVVITSQGVGAPGTTNNSVVGNFIGTTQSGTARLGNGGDGVDILFGATGNQIGGSGGVGVGGLGNLISANGTPNSGGDGIYILDASGNTVLGNLIGTDVTGTANLGNVGNGVRLFFAGSNVVGASPGGGNLISGNFHDGVQITFVANSNSVTGNMIGTTLGGASPLPNGGNGVDILQSSSGNSVTSNLISGNVGSGVVLNGGGTTGNRVQANLIGTTASGIAILGNQHDGVDIQGGAASNQIGGSGGFGPGASGNVISGNHGNGMVLSGAGTTLNMVQGNFIGTTAAGTAKLPNFKDGVDIVIGAANNLIGGTGFVGPGGLGNIISGNGLPLMGGNGVHIDGNGTNANTVQGNAIGTDATGKLPLGNLLNGVFVTHGAQHNVISGTTTTPGNTIAFNVKAGVAVGANAFDVTTVDNPIEFNSIYNNGALGIDLADDGVTPNHPFNPFAGPNHFQNFPLIVGAVAGGSVTRIFVALANTIPFTTFTIQIFVNPAADPSGYGQGQTLVASIPVTTNGLGNTPAPVMVLVSKNLATQFVSATATAPSGDTSEFAKSVKVAGALSKGPVSMSPFVAALLSTGSTADAPIAAQPVAAAGPAYPAAAGGGAATTVPGRPQTRQVSIPLVSHSKNIAVEALDNLFATLQDPFAPIF